VTDFTFTLAYNPSLLSIGGAFDDGGSDATDPAGTFAMLNNSNGVATFAFDDATPQAGTVVFGDILATVPNTARSLYQVKEQLQLKVLSSNGAAGTVTANGVHVNAYFGDASADHIVDGLDKLLMDNISQGRATGFSAFTQMDPAIVGDIGNDAAVIVPLLARRCLHGPNSGFNQIPVPSGLSGITSPMPPIRRSALRRRATRRKPAGDITAVHIGPP